MRVQARPTPFGAEPVEYELASLVEIERVFARHGFAWAHLGHAGSRFEDPTGLPLGVMREVLLTCEPEYSVDDLTGRDRWSFTAAYRSRRDGRYQSIGDVRYFQTAAELEVLVAQIGLKSIPPPFGSTWKIPGVLAEIAR